MTLDEIARKLECAQWPDREIDAEIHLLLGQVPNEHYNRPWRHPILLDESHRRPGLLEYVEISGVSARAAPSYTASLDAAIALVERVRPGWDWCLCKTEDGRFVSELEPSGCPGGGPTVEHRTPTLALCLALIRSIEGEKR